MHEAKIRKGFIYTLYTTKFDNNYLLFEVHVNSQERKLFNYLKRKKEKLNEQQLFSKPLTQLLPFSFLKAPNICWFTISL